MKRLIHFLLGFVIFVLIMPVSAMADDALCARVKIQINQELTLERQAFEAHMKITNGFSNIAVENVTVYVNFSDEDGNSVLASSDPDNTDALFFIRLDSMDGIENVDGGGEVAPSSSADITWLIIPATDSSNGVPQGTLYYVGATLTYTMAGQEQTTEVMPDYIYVKPMPELTLDYFLPTDVYGDDAFTDEIEPEVPFPLGVRVANNGVGTAVNLSINSAQPEIVENELGLLIGFNIETTEVNGQDAQPTLKADFGDIGPNEAGVAKWMMTCSLSGKFVSFEADFSHSDELGGELTSLMESVTTHFLVKDVRVDLAGRDEIDDFLSKDGSIYRVFESDNVDTVVTDYDDQQASISETGQDRYMLSMPVTSGFVYVQLPDPENGELVVADMVRSDGKEIKPENCWLSKTRDDNNNWLYFINLFDADTTGSYNVNFGPPETSHTPVLQFIADKTQVEGSQLGFLVQASDPDGTIPALSAAMLPSGATFTDRGDGTALFDWTPAIGQAGVYTVVFSATDGQHTATRSATLTILSGADSDSDNDGMPDAWELEHFGTLDRDGTGDYDGDGFSDRDEASVGSDPTDPDSQPGTTVLNLQTGYNLVSIPDDVRNYINLYNLMEVFGGKSVIENILVYETSDQRFIEAGYDATGSVYGENVSFESGSTLAGMIINAKKESSSTFDIKYCHTWDLDAGFSIVGTPCAAEALSAFQLLNNLGAENVSSIQRFNAITGKFETAAFDESGQPKGLDFLIMPGEGYYIHMKLDVQGYKP